MVKEIVLKGTAIKYDMQYKNVKNINLRIKPDGMVYVSANRRISRRVIEDFLNSKADFILKALKTFEKKASVPKLQYFSEEEIHNVVIELCEKTYPYFKSRGIKYPIIKFRRMVSQWGNCRAQKGVLTFNTNLMYAPIECIEYVVVHEFTHFLRPNHSALFYSELSKIMPDWKIRRQRLKEI